MTFEKDLIDFWSICIRCIYESRYLLFMPATFFIWYVYINVHIEYKVHVIVIELWGPYGHNRDTGL